MSLLHSFHGNIYFLSHRKFIETLYSSVLPNRNSDIPFLKIFDINYLFLRSNQSTIRKRGLEELTGGNDELTMLERGYEILRKDLHDKGVFTDDYPLDLYNSEARSASDLYFKSICHLNEISGGVHGDNVEIFNIQGQEYVFPPNCKFYCCPVEKLKSKIDDKFDFILIDPPWKNRFVKRRKKNTPHHGYCMMSDNQLLACNFELLLNDKGLMAVWTTNSASHINFIKEKLFPSCGVHYVATWYWLKLTKTGDLICPLSVKSGNKQPYERLIFGKRGENGPSPIKDGVIFFSIPSAIHSHKPPLNDLMKQFLNEDSKCLEVFARYLVPGWASCGDQVLSMQLLSLYQPATT